jgi:group I intron endonuclease
MLTNASGIYQIKNLVTNKVYIGSATSIRQRIYWHIRNLNNNKHHSILLQRSWNKHGQHSFEFKVLEECFIDLLEQREQFYLDWFECYKPDKGYNIYNIVGSPRGRKLTEEHKLKISKGGKGRKLSEETKKKISEYQKNRTKEHKQNMSKALKVRVFSDEHRRKLSEANQRRKLKGW